MSTSENTSQSAWEKIQTGVRETERLLGQKKYNLSMIRARQTLEFMVKSLCERSGIMEGGLIDMIDALYEEQIISKTTCEHYHKIRTIGNKAIHEEDNNAYNANQAHHLLSQEVYTFANDYNEKRRKPAARQTARSSAASSGSRNGRAPQRRTSQASNQRRRHKSGPAVSPASLIRILIPLAIVIILIFVIRIFMPDKEKDVETTAPTTTEALTTEAPTTTAADEPSTEAPTEAPAVTYKTNDTLNVREQPSTDSRKLVVLGPGSTVEYLRDYDDTWAVISYDGGEAYVSKQYIEPVSQ